ncbi:MAG: DUF3164 family protein [Caulobacteraceae bacterium]
MPETHQDASKAPPSMLPAGQEEYGGKLYMRDAKGSLTPLELVKASDRLEDEVVRDLIIRAEKVRAMIRSFRDGAFDEADLFQELMAGEYGVKLGGAKGNLTLQSYDGTQRVTLQVADLITFGPQLQVAKTIVDECLLDWGSDSRAEIRKIVQSAFDVDGQGKVNRGALLGLMRLDITDERWLRAMAAIKDSIKVTGSKRYMRYHKRADSQAPWDPIPLDAATA